MIKLHTSACIPLRDHTHWEDEEVSIAANTTQPYTHPSEEALRRGYFITMIKSHTSACIPLRDHVHWEDEDVSITANTTQPHTHPSEDELFLFSKITHARPRTSSCTHWASRVRWRVHARRGPPSWKRQPTLNGVRQLRPQYALLSVRERPPPVNRDRRGGSKP